MPKGVFMSSFTFPLGLQIAKASFPRKLLFCSSTPPESFSFPVPVGRALDFASRLPKTDSKDCSGSHPHALSGKAGLQHFKGIVDFLGILGVPCAAVVGMEGLNQAVSAASDIL